MKVAHKHTAKRGFVHGCKCKKYRYYSKDEALKAMDRLNARFEHKLKAAYKCPDSNFFHLTSKSKKASKIFRQYVLPKIKNAA